MQKTENSYLWPSRFESNPQSYGSKGARNFADVAHCAPVLIRGLLITQDEACKG